MTTVFQAVSNRIKLTKAGITKFDTLLKSFALVTSQAITASVTITFPDLAKSNMYYWQGNHDDPSHTREQAAVFITFLQQDWNKDAASPYNLPDILLGTAPAGTDYLDLQVNLTRTTTPTAILGDSIDPIPPAGKTISCPDGSCLLEEVAPLVRGFAVVLADTANVDGTINIYLRRSQSTKRDNRPSNTSAGWSASNGVADGDRFTWGTSGKGLPVYLSQQYGPTNISDPSQTYTHQRGGSSGLSLTDPTNFSSVYTGTLFITPGNFNVPPPSTSTAPSFCYASVMDSQASASTYTFTGQNILYADSTRKVVAVVHAHKASAGAIGVSSLTIGGVSATKVVEATQSSGSNAVVSSIWIANVPTGTTATVVVNLGGTMEHASVELYALYNMASSTPDATGSAVSTSGSFSLATANNGCAIGGFTYNLSSVSVINGMTYSGTDIYLTGGNRFMASGYGMQTTTGATLTVSNTQTGTTNAAMIAASFH